MEGGHALPPDWSRGLSFLLCHHSPPLPLESYIIFLHESNRCKLSNTFHAQHDELIVVELTCVGVQSSFSAWCQLHYGDIYAVFIFVAVRHRFQCFVALFSLCDSTHC